MNVYSFGPAEGRAKQFQSWRCRAGFWVALPAAKGAGSFEYFFPIVQIKPDLTGSNWDPKLPPPPGVARCASMNICTFAHLGFAQFLFTHSQRSRKSSQLSVEALLGTDGLRGKTHARRKKCPKKEAEKTYAWSRVQVPQCQSERPSEACSKE